MWKAIHTSETGRLENLNQLTPFGKDLLYTFVHLLIQGHNGQKLTEPMKTYRWLMDNPNIPDVSERHVLRILSKYRSLENNYPVQDFSSIALPTNGPCTESKLNKAKECEANCRYGGHHRAFMAKHLKVSVTTLKRKLGKKTIGRANLNPNPAVW